MSAALREQREAAENYRVAAGERYALEQRATETGELIDGRACRRARRRERETRKALEAAREAVTRARAAAVRLQNERASTIEVDLSVQELQYLEQSGALFFQPHEKGRHTVAHVGGMVLVWRVRAS